ncbi:MAG TPA: SpoIID/LytB domain-containing protein [Actinomycetota bacterium]|jgi:stage II sporulation protein D|nr:SpoIID/LytB domain-containing protein [Actinomycetota bacterium]
MKRLLAAVILVAVLAAAVPWAGAAPKARRLGAVAAPVRLVPTGAGALSVAGLGSYFGTIELKAAPDGIVVVNRLPLERYLLGLQEVPTEWPREALKAQAVAARTYALWTLGRPRAGSAAVYGFDICATVDCQVFTGAAVVTLPDGLRWAAAVRDTAGEAVLYGGAPILARYHSTSGGHTLDNPQVYTSEPAYPYLRGVPSTFEEGSPLYRWEVRFTVRRLERILRHAGWWRGNGRLIGVRTVPSTSGRHYPDVEYIGRRGRTTSTAEELRVLVRTAAPEMFPGDYPSRWPTSSGRLPETFPSNRLTISSRRGVVRVEGRGWGHGVGMSQWGAEGMARRGASYRDILRHYYRGAEIGSAPNPRIGVGVGWGLNDVAVSGAFRLVDARGRTLVEDALGTWRFRWTGTGTVGVEPPRGFGLPLEVGIVAAPRRVEVGEPAYLTIALSRPARVKTVTRAPGGFDDSGARVKSAGRRRIVWLAPVEPGEYEVRVQAAAAGARRESEPVRILVEAPDDPPVTARGAPEDVRAEDAPPRAALLALVLLVLTTTAAMRLSSRMAGWRS